MLEIERKFLIRQGLLPALDSGTKIRQAYLITTEDRSLRIRQKGERYILGIKIRADGIARNEYEMEIPASEGEALFDAPLVGIPVEKVRHLIDHEGHTWELDIFEGSLAGLIVAEIELSSENKAFARPDWLGEEVTGDPRYLNSALAKDGQPK